MNAHFNAGYTYVCLRKCLQFMYVIAYKRGGGMAARA